MGFEVVWSGGVGQGGRAGGVRKDENGGYSAILVRVKWREVLAGTGRWWLAIRRRVLIGVV